MHPEAAERKGLGGKGDNIRRYAIIIPRERTKEPSMSLCREAISFELLPTLKSIQSICDTDRNNLLQSSKCFFAEQTRTKPDVYTKRRRLHSDPQTTAEFSSFAVALFVNSR
jgi:hypothetical protein